MNECIQSVFKRQEQEKEIKDLLIRKAEVEKGRRKKVKEI